MADVVVDSDNKNSKELLGQGIRAYVLQDYNAAVSALSQAIELLVGEHGDDLHESLGEVYLYYGKALLGLSREESEALGDAVPKNAEDDSDEEEDVEEENDKPAVDNLETQNGEGPSSSTNEEVPDPAENDDEPTDLQVAWEVLELAKKIYQKQGESGKKNFADTLVVLGEVSLESENFEAAVNDISEGLGIQKELFGKDSRTVAETFYKLGIAYSTNSQIDEAIRSFRDALEYLRNRIDQLEKVEDKKDEVDEEVGEIKSLIPDIEEKITDMKTYKDEALKQLVSAVTGSAPAEVSSSTGASSSKPASDISHLVKRKRKLDEATEASEEAQAAKKPATQ